MKTIRKDKWKNRNRPKTTWPYNKRYKLVDGDICEVVERQAPVIGMKCGRCGDQKSLYNLKCDNRQRMATLPEFFSKAAKKSIEKQLPKDYEGYFCLVNDIALV